MPTFGVSKVHRAQADAATPTATLLTPTTYQQYLPLSAPMDVAVSDEYTAIADGNVIYIYNRLEGVYRTYEHTGNSTATMNQVTELEFSSDGDLYFLDGAPYLHVLEQSQLASLTDETKAQETKFTCSAFTLVPDASGKNAQDTIYFTHISGTTSNLSYTTLDRLDSTSASSLVEGISGKPAIAYYDGAIYYTSYSIYLRRINVLAESAPNESVCTFPTAIESLVLSGGELYLSDNLGNFYAYNLSKLEYTPLAEKVPPNVSDLRGGYGALSLYKDKIYAVRHQAIREYEVGKDFTDFEISANSDAVSRLSGATDSLLYGDVLYVADTGNSRISIYDTKAQSYSVLVTPAAPTLVAATEGSIAAASETSVWLFETGETQPVSFEGFNGKIVGIEGVYGKYYLVTDTNYYYVIEYLPLSNPDETNGTAPEYTWQKTGGKDKTKKFTPSLLTSDVYGNLYVAAVSGDLYKFTEIGFTNADDHGVEISSAIPAGATSLHADVNENVYLLKGTELFVYPFDLEANLCGTPTTYPLGKSLVYGQDDTTPVNSVAFDVAATAMYVTYAGNLMVAVTDIPFPTVRAIPTEDLETEIFSAQPAEFKVVETAANAFLVKFDLEALSLQAQSTSSSFPYLSHGREKAPRTALLLGEVGEYSVLAIFDKTTHKYSNYLTKTRYYATEKPTGEYLEEYRKEQEKTGYLTNAVTLYKYPYLTKLLRVDSLTKNQAVTLIGEVNDLDYNYYKVRVVSEDGTEKIGFVPQKYVTLFDGEPKPSETTTYGERQNPSEESLWRLTFLLLGTAAICILTDLLILHNRKKD